MNQGGRLPFDQVIEVGVLEQESHREVVHRQQRGSPNQSSQYGVVVADDGVLHSIGKRQQDHQIEGIQLRQLAFSCQA